MWEAGVKEGCWWKLSDRGVNQDREGCGNRQERVGHRLCKFITAGFYGLFKSFSLVGSEKPVLHRTMI